MRDVLTNLFKMQPQNLIPEVNYLAVLVWLMVLGCAFFSIKAQKIGIFGKVIWMALVLCLPFVGLLAYCVYCVTKLDIGMFPALTPWQQKAAAQSNAGTGTVVPLKTGSSRTAKSKRAGKSQVPIRQPIIAVDHVSGDRSVDGE